MLPVLPGAPGECGRGRFRAGNPRDSLNLVKPQALYFRKGGFEVETSAMGASSVDELSRNSNPDWPQGRRL